MWEDALTKGAVKSQVIYSAKPPGGGIFPYTTLPKPVHEAYAT
jgi:hypothetical protein